MFTDQAVSCPILPFLGALACSAGFWSIVETERSIRTTSEAAEQVQPILSEETSPTHLHFRGFIFPPTPNTPKICSESIIKTSSCTCTQQYKAFGVWCVGVKLFSWQLLQNHSEEYLYCCLNSLSFHRVQTAPSHSMEITSKDKPTGTM